MKEISFRKIQPLSIAILTAVLWIVSILKAHNVALWMGNLLTDASVVGIIACGMTFVMIAGGFDLSVGSIAAVCGVVAVLTMKAMAGAAPGFSIFVAVLATMVTGVILGAINGGLISYVGVNPFVVTLSTMFVFRGIGLVLTSGGQSQVVPIQFTECYRLFYWGGFHVLGLKISVPVLISIEVLLVSAYVLRLTRFGHYVYATGGNRKASWLAGINTHGVIALTYVLSGLVC